MKLSQEKKDKISEQILVFLYSINPRSVFTSHLAKELARDEDFVKKLLRDLNKKGLVVEINKNPEGSPYLRRARWKISDAVFQVYQKYQ